MKWTGAFKYLPIEYGMTLAEAADRTERVSFDNNLEGDCVRLLLSNRYADTPLHIRRMTIGREVNGAVAHPVEITRDGKGEITLRPDETAFSDTAEIAVHPGERLAVSVYLEEPQQIGSVCGFWSPDGPAVSWNLAGDACGGERMEAIGSPEIYDFVRNDPGPVKGQFFYGFSEVQVLTGDEVRVITAFGDSITHMSYVTNALAKRLYEAWPGEVTLLNTGIGGDRLVHDGTWIPDAPAQGRLFGRAGVARFEEDVFGTDRTDTVLCLMGVNDIMHPLQFEHADASTAAPYLEEGLTYLAGKAHAHGARFFGATVTPCGNAQYPAWWLPAFEKTRLPLNEWIRRENPFDGYFDYDAAVRDDRKPGYLKPDVHIGDGLHPNRLGGQLIADAIDLEELMGIKKEGQTIPA